MLVYLAGCITHYEKLGRLEKAIEWRENAEQKLKDNGFKVFNPMTNYKINASYEQQTPQGIILQNFNYLSKADILLVNLELLEQSPGTIWEMSIAWYLHKPVLAFGYTPLLQRAHTQALITIRFTNLDDTLDYICSMYNQQ